MTFFVKKSIGDPPEGATHFNGSYSLCWEKHVSNTDKVYVYSHHEPKGWGNQINRSGGLRIQQESITRS